MCVLAIKLLLFIVFCSERYKKNSARKATSVQQKATSVEESSTNGNKGKERKEKERKEKKRKRVYRYLRIYVECYAFNACVCWLEPSYCFFKKKRTNCSKMFYPKQ